MPVSVRQHHESVVQVCRANNRLPQRVYNVRFVREGTRVENGGKMCRGMHAVAQLHGVPVANQHQPATEMRVQESQVKRGGDFA